MKVLFISGLYPHGIETSFEDNLKHGCHIHNAPNVYQWGVVKGLIENGVEIEVASFPFLPTYPYGYSQPFLKTYPIHYEERQIGASYSYCTIMGLKERSIINRVKRVIKRWKDKLEREETGLLLVYAIYGPFLKAAVDLARQEDRLLVCPIATDLFLDSPERLKKLGLLKRLQGYFEYRRIKYGLEYADFFVLLAKGMERFIPRAKNNSVIIEGIAIDNKKQPQPKQETKERTLLYSGSLEAHTSVRELVDAFMLTTDVDFRLNICGSGLYENYIKEKALIDQRINYLGSIPRNKVLALQKSATALINPRLSTVEDTPYSFPSKTIEYLVSGTPMIGYKLLGITNDYYAHFYIPEDETPMALASQITEVLTKSQAELDAKALDAWRFITSNKNAKAQLSKLVRAFETYRTQRKITLDSEEINQ